MANDKNEKKVKKHFFKDFKSELKKVVWPTPKQLVNGTIAVITIVLVTATIVFVLDLGFEMLNKYGINGLKKITENSASQSVDNNTVNEPANGNNTVDNNTLPEGNTVQ